MDTLVSVEHVTSERDVFYLVLESVVLYLVQHVSLNLEPGVETILSNRGTEPPVVEV